MIITNEEGYPQALVDACQSDYELEPNEWRVTSLLKGPREAILERRHSHEITRDVSDMIWLLFGTSVHSLLERVPIGPLEFREERIKIPIGGYVLSGKFDSYDAGEKLLTDYKTCSVWQIINKRFDHWRQQLLIYAWMLNKIGFECNRARVMTLAKDHRRSLAKFEKGYPRKPGQAIPFTFSKKDFDGIEVWLTERFNEIARLEKVPDDQLPVCTAEERYNSGTKYAVMKKGKKRAVRLFDNAQAAQDHIAKGKGDFVEIRPGEDKKCMDYCVACEFCNYYKEKVEKHVQSA